ncbi:MAG: hypothetical protein FJ126_07240 [Deltaproteobacteria bacterium]|nr:hypothetical protein [Deltaproteobacteria bacterium]
MNTWLRTLVLMVAASLIFGCTAGNPYIYTGAALGTGVGALGGAAIDSTNPYRGAAIGGLLGAVLGGVGGEVVRQQQYPQAPQGYYQPGYGPPRGYAPPPGYSAPPRYGYSAPPPGNYSQGQSTPGPQNYSQAPGAPGPQNYSQPPSAPGPQNYSQAPSEPAPQYSYRRPPVNSYYYYPESKSDSPSGSDPNFGPGD